MLLIQTRHDPSAAAAALARLLAQLKVIDAAGIITAAIDPVPPPARAAGAEQAARPSTGRAGADGGGDVGAAVAGGVRLRFVPFPEPAAGRHTGAEYR